MSSIHAIPVGGEEPMHHTVDCWCFPISKEGVTTHNAKDCRERFERQGVTHKDKHWVLVSTHPYFKPPIP